MKEFYCFVFTSGVGLIIGCVDDPLAPLPSNTVRVEKILADSQEAAIEIYRHQFYPVIRFDELKAWYKHIGFKHADGSQLAGYDPEKALKLALQLKYRINIVDIYPVNDINSFVDYLAMQYVLNKQSNHPDKFFRSICIMNLISGNASEATSKRFWELTETRKVDEFYLKQPLCIH